MTPVVVGEMREEKRGEKKKVLLRLGWIEAGHGETQCMD